MNLHMHVGNLRFVLRLEDQAAPLTCDAFVKALPFRSKLIQARWSGEAAWMPENSNCLPVAKSLPSDPGLAL